MDQDALGCLSLAGVAGDSVTVVQVGVLSRVELDTSLAFYAQAHHSILRNTFHRCQFTIGDLQVLVRRGELNPVANRKELVLFPVDRNPDLPLRIIGDALSICLLKGIQPRFEILSYDVQHSNHANRKLIVYYARMIPRAVAPAIEHSLAHQAAVAIIGPRQVGKTTLARAIADNRPASVYLDLEAREDRDRLAEPTLFLRQYENSLVVLDEIHRVPELFSSLRGIIDKGRRSGHGTGRFLILGSASIDLLRQSSESLAGRITYIPMGPFNVMELPADEPTLLQLWTRGGFPGSYLAPDDSVSLRWRDDFIRTYLERDVPLFGPRVPAGVLERLWTMLAHGHPSRGHPLVGPNESPIPHGTQQLLGRQAHEDEPCIR